METKTLTLSETAREATSKMQWEKKTIIAIEPYEYRVKDPVTQKMELVEKHDTVRLLLNDNTTLLAPRKGLRNVPSKLSQGVVANIGYQEGVVNIGKENEAETLFIRIVEFDDVTTKKVYISDEQAKLIFG